MKKVICCYHHTKLVIESWEEYRIFEEELRKFLKNVDTHPKIREALEYILSAGGKRIRPIIALISGKLCGGSYKRLMNFAIAGELLHTASLVHDDLIDRANLRRNSLPIHVKYGEEFAIVFGDWLISKAIELLSIYGEEVIRDSAFAGLKMCEGELIDIYSKTSEFGEEEYFECIEKKTAYAFAYSAKIACKIVCKDSEAMENLQNYGLSLGIAYQLVDDLLEYLEVLDEKRSQLESLTLPQLYEKKFGKEKAIKEILRLISVFAEKSKEYLASFPGCEEKRKLERIVDIMTFEMLEKRLPIPELSK
ncbi:MAG: octaprenyl-diphosphate synthase [Archaeoglobaceae archaeon]|nr:octaprenyl-diphosphate synthase [Archaeoglobaceae archaeon]